MGDEDKAEVTVSLNTIGKIVGLVAIILTVGGNVAVTQYRLTQIEAEMVKQAELALQIKCMFAEDKGWNLPECD